MYRILLVMLFYATWIEGKSKESRKNTTKGAQRKHKGKKQFFPGGNVGYPSPYPINFPNPQLKPAPNPYGQEVKFAKGFPAAYDCTRSKHGCCWDGRTPSHGKAGKGCPQCRDVYKDFCKKTNHLCHFPMVADYCRITCKLCSRKKKNTCQMSRYNCCWDGVTSATGPYCKGCPKIQDKLERECKKFESECLRNPYYMWTECRETCLKSLPPIEPFLQMVTSSNNQGFPSVPYGQPTMPIGMPAAHTAGTPSLPVPFPGMSQGKKAARVKKHKDDVHSN